MQKRGGIILKHTKKLLTVTLLALTLCSGSTSATYAKASKTKTKLSFTTSGTITVPVKHSYRLTVTNGKTKSAKILYKSSNPKIIRVSKKGKVTAKEKGKATVTAYLKKNHKIKTSCTIYAGAKVKNVKLSTTKKTLEPKQTYKINAKVTPSKAAYKKLRFSSSNTKIASVSPNGKITAKRCGECKILVTSKDGTNIVKKLNVTVKIRAKKLHFKTVSHTLTVGDIIYLDPVISPENTTDQRIRYTSSDPDIAQVTSSGKVKAVRAGSVTITGTMRDGSNKSATCQIHVQENPWNLKLASQKLNIVSSYGDTQAYHPKVLNFEKPWNGYRYWMAYTPYPAADQTKENPHITVSNDKVHWETIDEVKTALDPLTPFEDPSRQYNSDTHLVYREDIDTLECYWRQVDDIRGTDTIFKRTTKDGKHWTDREQVLQTKTGDDGILSPAIIYENGKYKMWTINYFGKFPIRYRESEDGYHWSKPREITLQYDSEDLRSWHLDVIHTEKGYEILVVAFKEGDNHLQMNMYYTKSKDNITYNPCITVLKPSTSPVAWDNRGIYRSCFFVEDGNYYVYYSGIGYPKGIHSSRGVGLSIGSSIEDLKGYDR